MKKKILSLTLVVCLLAIAVVGGTLAYFTDTDNVATNTFTVGDVKIKLDETDVNLYGVKDGNTRVATNEYKLIPGHTYVKDPMVTVEGDSEEAYVRMFVTIKDMKDLKAALGDDFLPQYFVEGWDSSKWISTEVITPSDNGDTLTYEFRYYKTVSTVDGGNLELEPLFTRFKLPGTVTNDQVAKLEELEIVVTAQAIQADGFAGPDAAFGELPAVPAV